jgi:membrane-associated protease RseP (regulator of RpoE activity)
MNIDYIKQIMDEELGNEFLLDQNSLFRGKLVYYVPRTHISLEQIQRKKEELYNRYRIVTALESDNMYYILRVLGVAQEKPHKTKIWLHAILVLLTVFTTSAAGALLRGHLFWEGWRQFLIGLPYSLALLSILTAHELGHYVTALKHKVKATLPYYIPFFIPAFNLGTMGAFIKILSPIPDRKALLKIGIMGPIAGFILTLIFLIVGYATLPDVEGIRAYIETIHPLNGQPEPGTNLILGKSVLIWFFNDVIAGGRLPMNEMYHFPFIFAGWVGLLVTAINLMPIGQLDGGHISYALFGPKAKYISFLTFGMLILLNFFSLNYLIWTLLIFFIVKFRHPPTLNDYIPLSRTERILGYVGYIIFIISFIPMPLMIT